MSKIPDLSAEDKFRIAGGLNILATRRAVSWLFGCGLWVLIAMDILFFAAQGFHVWTVFLVLLILGLFMYEWRKYLHETLAMHRLAWNLLDEYAHGPNGDGIWTDETGEQSNG